ncbi:MAG: hypothetical protein LWX83_02515, partial [Anaerolineae bacterium]|nr:hypothetical protein [Anaerolineae bacterium]
MEKEHKPLAALRLSGIYSLSTGIAHLAVSPFILFSGFEKLSFENLSIFVYVYLVCGLALILCGRLLMICAAALKNNNPWARSAAFSAAGFVFLAGLGALAGMPFNPISYLILLGGV